MKTVEIGSKIKINESIGTVLKIQDGLALVQWDSGSKTCYGVNGIKQNHYDNPKTSNRHRLR